MEVLAGEVDGGGGDHGGQEVQGVELLQRALADEGRQVEHAAVLHRGRRGMRTGQVSRRGGDGDSGHSFRTAHGDGHSLVGVAGLEEADEEAVGRADSDIELERRQHAGFHVQDLWSVRQKAK